MDRLQRAAAELLENRVPIPDKEPESDYVTRFHIRGLKEALEAETNRRDKQAELVLDLLAALGGVQGAHTHIETCDMPPWLDAVEEALARAEEVNHA